jgi:hypothetical protein
MERAIERPLRNPPTPHAGREDGSRVVPVRPSHDFGLLLAAHGERRAEADNHGIAHLAKRLADRGVADEVGFGFIKGEPSIGDAVARISSRDLAGR